MRYLILEGGKHLVSVVRPEWPHMRTRAKLQIHLWVRSGPQQIERLGAGR